MSLAAIVLCVLLAFAAAYALYGRMLSRLLGLDAKATTPAHACEDGEDFVPTKKFYLLSQHFSAISAAGPIAGPILAASMFGWEPALWWIVIGCIFIGSMHDFAALVGFTTWLDSQEELDRLLPPVTHLKRWIGRWVRKAV